MIEQFERQIGYQFNDQALLEHALRHRSARGESNERLEFLGDAILNFVIASALYKQFPEAKEGELSRLRATLVKGDTLAELAQDFSVGDYIELGLGEMRSGGTRRASILADAMEAVIGSIYLDAGIQVCQERILAWYEQRLADIDLSSGYKDPKTRLQELLQAQQLPLPTYEVTDVRGKAHNQKFYVACQVEGLEHVAKGQGSSRRKAEQAAAESYLELLSDE